VGAPTLSKEPGLESLEGTVSLMLPCGTSRLAAVLSGGTQVPSIATSPFEHIRSDGSAMAVGAQIMANTADAEPAAAAKSRAVRDLGTRITQN
jgi:hypothetical protein